MFKISIFWFLIYLVTLNIDGAPSDESRAALLLSDNRAIAVRELDELARKGEFRAITLALKNKHTDVQAAALKNLTYSRIESLVPSLLDYLESINTIEAAIGSQDATQNFGLKGLAIAAIEANSGRKLNGTTDDIVKLSAAIKEFRNLSRPKSDGAKISSTVNVEPKKNGDSEPKPMVPAVVERKMAPRPTATVMADRTWSATGWIVAAALFGGAVVWFTKRRLSPPRS